MARFGRDGKLFQHLMKVLVRPRTEHGHGIRVTVIRANLLGFTAVSVWAKKFWVRLPSFDTICMGPEYAKKLKEC